MGPGGRLAEVLNPIDICQYDDGLVEVRAQLNCTAGQPRTDVTVRAVDGRLPASTAQPLCG